MRIIKIFTFLVLVILTSGCGQNRQEKISDSQINTNNKNIRQEIKVDSFLGLNDTQQIKQEEDIDNKDKIEDILLESEKLVSTEIKEDKNLKDLESTTENDITELVNTLFEIDN